MSSDPNKTNRQQKNEKIRSDAHTDANHKLDEQSKVNNQMISTNKNEKLTVNSIDTRQIATTTSSRITNRMLNKSSWLNNIMGCISPILDSIGFVKPPQPQSTNEWIVKFSSITNLEYISAGAEGKVYRGKLNAREIAIKKVRAKEEIEIKHLSKLKHNNIVRFIGVCVEPYCILMEYCQYGNLTDYLYKHKYDIEPDLVWEFAFQITSGMNYLNYNGIIHRDLKGFNILVCHDNQLKICDFGKSKKSELLAANQMTLVGTCAYIAPEVIKSANYDEKIDIWSFGVVCWELLSCEIPYRNIDGPRIMYGVFHNRFKLPISSECPEGFKLLMEMCFARRPKDRPTFSKILLHLQIFCKDHMYRVSLKKFNEMKRKWRKEIRSVFESYSNFEINDDVLDDKQKLADQQDYLENTIKLSQDVLRMYKEKLSQVNELYSEMNDLLETVQRRQEELNQLVKANETK